MRPSREENTVKKNLNSVEGGKGIGERRDANRYKIRRNLV